MALRICAVFHSDKQGGAAGKPPVIAVNPPMTIAGMEKIHALVSKIDMDPRLPLCEHFDALYSSPLARALDAASVFATSFYLDIKTIGGLGQMANKEGNEVIKHPSHMKETVVTWQKNAMETIKSLADDHEEDDIILIVSHRPVIGGLVAWARGIVGDHAALDQLIADPALVKDGYVVLDYDIDEDEISEVPL